MKNFDVCVFAGRFRPFHAGHLHVIRAALENAQYAFVIVGSINEPINFRNPFTFGEVREMIRGSLTPAENDRVFLLGVEDYDTNTKWVAAVQALVAQQIASLSLGVRPQIALCGYSKDESSFYLKLFPQWASVEVKDGNPNIDATDFRSDLYEFEFTALRRWNDAGSVPAGTHLFLRQWLNSSEFSRLRAEYRFMTEYLADFPQTPYPRFFTATDACVIQSGHVLLVRRSQLPGKGLWALPGGHVNMHETFKDAAIRELIEETAIGLPGWSDTGTGPQSREELLRQAIRGEKFLDNPWRSTRMRTISMAYGFHLVGTKLPYVKGSDDASEEQGGCARWWSLDEVTREMMFEDHYNVIQHFANQFRDL